MTASTPKAVRRFFDGRYRDAGSAARAAAGKAYLKSDLRFYGTTVPEIRRAVSDFAREHRDLTRTELRRIVDELWSTESYELRSAGIALLSRYADLLEERDLASCSRVWRRGCCTSASSSSARRSVGCCVR